MAAMRLMRGSMHFRPSLPDHQAETFGSGKARRWGEEVLDESSTRTDRVFGQYEVDCWVMAGVGRIDLSGKSAIVTGGASGMGEATVRLLAERGAKVLVADRNGEGAAAVAKDVGEAAVPFTVDVSQADECAAMVAAAREAFGGLDAAVNCAGVSEGTGTRLADTTLETWRRVISINLEGVFYCMRAEIPAMIERGGGSIINIGSIMSVAGLVTAASYTAAKHGVLGLTRSAALEYGDQGVRINCVGPGNMDTPMTHIPFQRAEVREAQIAPQGIHRLGEAWEVAEMVAFLASDAAGFCTGGWFGVDGGFTAR
jgi:NAD(P)-dependent dehydrogenase (short-subunit alcohol dehydrogenase family)